MPSWRDELRPQFYGITPTYSECKNCAFRIRCSRLSESTIAYLYMSFRDNGVVFLEANLSNSSISTPTVLTEMDDVDSKVCEVDSDSRSVVTDADASLGFVGSESDRMPGDDETMGFFQPDAVGFVFLATRRCAAAWVCACRSVAMCDETSVDALEASPGLLPPTPPPRHLLLDAGFKFCWVEYSTTLATAEVLGFC